MSNQPLQGLQLNTILPFAPFGQTSFDLNKADAFAVSLGIDFTHFKAMPSPIGLKDRGEYRREDGVDVLSSNGMLYYCAGIFTATMTDDSKDKKRVEQGILEPTNSRLVMSRFYKNADGTNNTEPNPTRIYLTPGDRLYLSDKNADVRVPKSQEMSYEENVDNQTAFPIWEMDPTCPVIDSTGATYTLGSDFCVTKTGDIRWINGGRNPGIDPDTGKGRVYSIRYMYRAFWYVLNMIKDIRITNVTEGGIRVPERMAQHCVIVRENFFHNQNKGAGQETLKSKTPQRADAAPAEVVNVTGEAVNVDITNFGMPDQSDNGE
jgi:hypothetical protein